jgi:hypothetical protein
LASRDVGRKTRLQCAHDIGSEVAAWRMQEPMGKRATEIFKLK